MRGTVKQAYSAFYRYGFITKEQSPRGSGEPRNRVMAEITRTGVSIEDDLLQQFDALIVRRGYKNRSEAIRDLIRETLVNDAVDANRDVVATLSMVYDHHLPNLGQKLTEMQH